jgi:hypothetical protein
MALLQRKPAKGLIHHSDRGSPADPMSSHRQVCMPVMNINGYWT